MPLAEQIDAPPCVFLRDILGAIIRHIIPAVHRLDPRPAVSVKPLAPNFGSSHILAITPQRMDMIPVPPRILLQRVEIRHAPHLRPHKLFVTPPTGIKRRFPFKRQVGDDLPRGQRMHPIAHFNRQRRSLDPIHRLDISRTVHIPATVHVYGKIKL